MYVNYKTHFQKAIQMQNISIIDKIISEINSIALKFPTEQYKAEERVPYKLTSTRP